ncbi:MAG: LacI family DNA-binding transcriptional regulator [Kiritimatiellae bacterium]|nr:LacI family DNA-binding transcriptional regulator [Kiritimatiellia bacterium]
MGKNPSVVAIGKAAGVSHTTVCDVLNDRWKARRVSEATKDRVLQVARELNYRPNRLVKAIRSGRTQTVALIVPVMEGEYFPRIVFGIEREAKRHGYHLLVSEVARGSGEDEVREIEILLERRVDGLILVPRHIEANRANYRRLVAQGIPLVFVDSYLPDVPCPAIAGNDKLGMRAAAEHLIALGHRRIAYVGVEKPTTHMYDRVEGFRAAMEAHGLDVPGGYARAPEREAIAELLRRPDRPSAILAATDYIAATVLRVAESLGLRIPADIAVIGFSDCLANTDLFRVPLASVRTDLGEMGRLAMQQFLREVEKVSCRRRVTRVKSQLVVRASCGGEMPAAAADMVQEQGGRGTVQVIW